MGFIWGKNERLLTGNEEKLIRKVFRTTSLPPLFSIRIRDGLTPTGTPFTTPRTKVEVIGGYAIETKGEYLIMVGPRLFNGDLFDLEPGTLVHEMTHVWQYKHRTLTEFQGFRAHAHYAIRGKLGGRGTDYLYTYKIGGSWDDMGFEGQAQLVEDWYNIETMSETGDRWVYVKNVLMNGDLWARYSTLDDLREPMVPDDYDPVGERKVSRGEIPFQEGYLLDLLGQAIPLTDVPRLAARVKSLTTYFRQLRQQRPHEAIALANRLQVTRPGDKLAYAFNYRLKTVTRLNLIKVLRGVT